MAKHNELGQHGESIARQYLEKKGHQILETNWRTGRAEIDIITKWNDILVFVEVKTRSDNYFGEPEDFINQKKKDLLIGAAGIYMELVHHDWEIRFDVIAIIIKNDHPYIKHIEDAFW